MVLTGILDFAVFQGTCGIPPWGYTVSISGITSCGCVSNGAAAALASNSINLITPPNITSPTLPVDGTCFNVSNTATWMPTGNARQGSGANYNLQDPQYEWGTGDALATVDEYDSYDCSGTARSSEGLAIQATLALKLYGPDLIFSLVITSPGDNGFVDLFRGSSLATCVFTDRETTIENQLVCNSTNWANAAASGGTATIRPVSIGGKVLLSCGQDPTGDPNAPIPVDKCGSSTGTAEVDWPEIQAIDCYGQCIGAATSGGGGGALIMDQYHRTQAGAFETSGGKLRGLGDLVHGFFRVIGLAAVVKGISEKTGKPCGCPGRIDKLNKFWPF
jgi:hypothetical protein